MFSNCNAIFSFFGVIISATIALIIYHRNRRYDQAKEKLKNLYNPLNAIIEKREKYLSFLKDRDRSRYEVEYYQFFLELRDIYLAQASYGTYKLGITFHSLLHTHEMEYSNADNDNPSEEEMTKQIAHFELNYKVDQGGDSEFESKMDELIRIISIEQEHLNKEINFKFREEIYRD